MAMPGVSAHPKHGSLGGHALPGAFFITWGLWWFFQACVIHFRRAHRRKAFRARAHYGLPLAGAAHLEAAAKLALPFVGILGELYFSHHARWRCAARASGLGRKREGGVARRPSALRHCDDPGGSATACDCW